MSKYHRSILPGWILLFVLTISLAAPVPALADDGIPPAPVTEEPVQEVTIAGVLEVAPAGTDVIVLNEGGSEEPLVSESAATIVIESDPMWCPAGETPINDLVDGSVECRNFGTPQQLINDMNLNPVNYAQDGTIYFTVDPAGSFILIQDNATGLSAATWTTLSQRSLTLQGSWNGKTDSDFVVIPAGSTIFGSRQVQIGTAINPWIGGVTVNDLTIDGATGNGLTIYGAGNIFLDRVTAINNTSSGALLDNTIGSGDVEIYNSQFDSNTSTGQEAGLNIGSYGNVVLDNVSASNNKAGDGADIAHASSLTVRNSTFSGNSSDDDYFGYGLYVEDTDDVSIDGNPSTINNNSASGLYLHVYNDISLNHVIVNGNGKGTAINLTIYSGADISTSGNVTIDCSEYNNNGSYGIDGNSIEGVFTVNDVTFTDNPAGDISYGQNEPVILSGGCTLLVNEETPIVEKHNGGDSSQSCAGGEIGPLPNGDKAVLPCLYSGILYEFPGNRLPAPIGTNYTFLRGVSLLVVGSNGDRISTVQPNLTVEFLIPAGEIRSNLVILHWSEERSEWIPLEGSKMTSDGYLQAHTNATGIFILVRQ